jgi:hypothetical protein
MDNPIEGERERFQVTDDSQAAWAMRKLLSLREKMTENENIAEAERYRINSWLEYANSRYEDDVVYFEGLLTQYAKTQRETEGRKTIDTPYGFVKSRATQPKFKVTDEDEFFKWAAESLPDAVAVKYTPVIPVMRNALTVEHTTTLGLVAMTENGEIVPGVTVEPAGVNYNVEVTK